MADVRLNSLTFPDLPDRYVIKDYDTDIADMWEDIYNLYPRKSLASAPIHAFSDGADNIPIKAMSVAVRAVQSGSGDPSPSNVRPIVGWDEASVVGSGKNMLDNKRGSSATTINGVTFTPQSDGSVLVTGTANGGNANYLLWSRGSDNVHLPSVEYTLTGCPSGGSASTYQMQAQATRDGALQGFGNDRGSGVSFTPRASDIMQITISIINGYSLPTGGLRFYPMLRPSSITDATYAPYNGKIVTMSFGESVYGGTLDLVDGKNWTLTIDRAYVALDSSFAGTIDLATNANTQQVLFRAAVTGADTTKLTDVQTNYFEGGTTSTTPYRARVSQRGTVFDVAISFPVGTFSDVNDFKTNWLTGKTLQVVYYIATHRVVEIEADADTVTQYADNVLYCDCGDSSLTYRQDIGLVIGG